MRQFHASPCHYSAVNKTFYFLTDSATPETPEAFDQNLKLLTSQLRTWIYDNHCDLTIDLRVIAFVILFLSTFTLMWQDFLWQDLKDIWTSRICSAGLTAQHLLLREWILSGFQKNCRFINFWQLFENSTSFDVKLDATQGYRYHSEQKSNIVIAVSEHWNIFLLLPEFELNWHSCATSALVYGLAWPPVSISAREASSYIISTLHFKLSQLH